MIPFALITVAIVAAVAAILITRPLRERRRVRAIAEWADNNGWTPAEPDAQLPRRWRGGPFLQGIPEPATDVLYGEESGYKMVSFTHTWRAGGQASVWSRKRHAHVIALDAEPGEPRLELTPEDLRDKVQKVFGGQDVIVGNPAFDDAWRVRSSDDDYARRVLDPRFMSMLLLPDYQSTRIRVDGPVIMLWRSGRTKAANMSTKTSKLAEIARMVLPLQREQPTFQGEKAPGMGFEKI